MTCFYALCERGRWGRKQIGEDRRDEGAGMSMITLPPDGKKGVRTVQ
jgi:hypothetical protein